jgi:hypothetical protein
LEYEGEFLCKYAGDSETWWPVLTGQYGCSLVPAPKEKVPVDDVYYNEKRQNPAFSPSDIGQEADKPLVDPSDPAAAYFTGTNNCPAGNEALESGSDSELSTGAWVAISIAIVVVGVVLVLALVLTYMYKSKGPYHRLETL